MKAAAERVEPPARVLRSGKRMNGTSAPASQTRRVKTEKIDAVRLDDDPPRALAPGNSLSGTSRKPGPMLPSVAPPTRSAKPPAARPEAQSKGHTQPKNMHARIPPVAGVLRTGPVFHSQFQNNGPLDFIPSTNMVRGRLVPVAYTPQAVGAQMHAHVLPSLAPAFDWGTHAPAQSAPAHVADGPVSASARKFNVRHATLIPTLQIRTPSNWGMYAQPPLTTVPVDESVLLSIDNDVLDPARAPLKHLTEILHTFRDECGTYSRVLAPDAHDSLLKCLLDENMMPFQAAMGLAFLSRLGFQWN